MTSHREQLKQQLRKTYDSLRSQGMSKGEAIDALMDYNVQVKQLFTDQTVIQFIFNANYGLGGEKQRAANQRTASAKRIKNLQKKNLPISDSPKAF